MPLYLWWVVGRGLIAWLADLHLRGRKKRVRMQEASQIVVASFLFPSLNSVSQDYIHLIQNHYKSTNFIHFRVHDKSRWYEIDLITLHCSSLSRSSVRHRLLPLFSWISFRMPPTLWYYCHIDQHDNFRNAGTPRWSTLAARPLSSRRGPGSARGSATSCPSTGTTGSSTAAAPTSATS